MEPGELSDAVRGPSGTASLRRSKTVLGSRSKGQDGADDVDRLTKVDLDALSKSHQCLLHAIV